MKLRTLTTLKALAVAAGALVLSSGIAAAATATNDLNLRSGPGTGYRVIGTMPAGAYVDVIGCGGSWCRVNWQGVVGYASASYLAGGGAYASAPRVYVAPPPPVVFGFGWGGPRWHGPHRWHGHRGWHRGHHWR
ncbi:SH3 domain-containing protein [Undibacter mobilis]|uniref:SH3 domain-containing protein n=1 Tax=Undibacter mobilis TaxID=2292256 RepID=A0A371BCG7_9BRAD|nr:SH3 domain-containing protein [Undibacter mobilis]RDV05262.1 SH3 domain-containing protein [Undibacter mobilis]